MACAHVIDGRRVRHWLHECFAKSKRRHIGYADRLGSQVHEFHARLQRFLNVPPQIDHWVKLEHASTVDGVQIVVIQKVINHVLAQTGADQAGQANDQVIFEMALDKFFQQAAMQAVGMQTVLVNRGVFIHANGAFEDIDGADQDKGVAGDGFEVCNEAVDVLTIGNRVTIGYPFLGGSGGTNYRVEIPVFNVLNVSGTIQ